MKREEGHSIILLLLFLLSLGKSGACLVQTKPRNQGSSSQGSGIGDLGYTEQYKNWWKLDVNFYFILFHKKYSKLYFFVTQLFCFYLYMCISGLDSSCGEKNLTLQLLFFSLALWFSTLVHVLNLDIHNKDAHFLLIQATYSEQIIMSYGLSAPIKLQKGMWRQEVCHFPPPEQICAERKGFLRIK